MSFLEGILLLLLGIFLGVIGISCFVFLLRFIFWFLCFNIEYFCDRKKWVKLKYREYKMYKKLESDAWVYNINTCSFNLEHEPTKMIVDLGFFGNLYLAIKTNIIVKINKIKKKKEDLKWQKVENSKFCKEKEIEFLTWMTKVCSDKKEYLLKENKEINSNIEVEINKMKEIVKV